MMSDNSVNYLIRGATMMNMLGLQTGLPKYFLSARGGALGQSFRIIEADNEAGGADPQHQYANPVFFKHQDGVVVSTKRSLTEE